MAKAFGGNHLYAVLEHWFRLSLIVLVPFPKKRDGLSPSVPVGVPSCGHRLVFCYRARHVQHIFFRFVWIIGHIKHQLSFSLNGSNIGAQKHKLKKYGIVFDVIYKYPKKNIMNRVNNPSKYLKDIVEINQIYCIGFGIDHLTDVGKKSNTISDILSERKKSETVTGKSGSLRENTVGKFVRKIPENKITRTVHIKYYSKRFEKDIAFDRDFIVWEKELLHRFNLSLSKAITPQKETILYFPFQKHENSSEHYRKAGAAMNMAIQLGSYYQIFDENFDPIIPVTQYRNKSILPPGNYASVEEKLNAITDEINSVKANDDKKGNSYRFATLREHHPTEVTAGNGGFHEYLMFEFKDSDLMILENLISGNATYIFKLSKFDKEFQLDKQNAKTVKSYLARIVHGSMDEWNNRVSKYFKKIIATN